MGLFHSLRDYVHGLQEKERGKYVEAPPGAPKPPSVDGATPAAQQSRTSPVEAAVAAATRTARTKSLDVGKLTNLDLGELPSLRLRVTGTAYVVPDGMREHIGRDSYLLVREPGNSADRNAVAVYWSGMRVGYLSRAKAASYAALLDGMAAEAFRVNGAPPRTENSVVLFLNLPSLPALREFARTHVA